MVAERRRHQFPMYKHQVPCTDTLGVGGGQGKERRGGARPGVTMLKAASAGVHDPPRTVQRMSFPPRGQERGEI